MKDIIALGLSVLLMVDFFYYAKSALLVVLDHIYRKR